MILYCTLCSTGYGTAGEVPVKCPSCQRETKWTSSPRGAAVPGWNPNENDRRMLRSLRIDPE